MLSGSLVQDSRNAQFNVCPDYLAQKCLHQIDDPLWKYVCNELLSMMGPSSVVKLWDCKLNFSCPGEKGISISCSDPDSADFIEKYDFVILNVLKKYFSSVNKVNVEIE